MNKKRIFLYALPVMAMFFFVIIKQNIVTAKRDKKTVSMFSERQERGKPVTVKTVEKQDVSIFTKITVVPVGGSEYEGYVPKVIREKFSVGQDVFVREDTSQAIGKVILVAEAIDLNTGMFRVALSIPDADVAMKGRLVVYVQTGILPDAVCVSNDVLDRDGDHDVLWVAENGGARKRMVEIQERNGYGTIIRKGLQDGDLLIVQGFTQLSENEKVDILNMSASEGDSR
ncbi:MAG: hypothetical protein WC552_08225 [Candidatus Omnitrophota bacterium]